MVLFESGLKSFLHTKIGFGNCKTEHFLSQVPVFVIYIHPLFVLVILVNISLYVFGIIVVFSTKANTQNYIESINILEIFVSYVEFRRYLFVSQCLDINISITTPPPYKSYQTRHILWELGPARTSAFPALWTLFSPARQQQKNSRVPSCPPLPEYEPR